MSRLLFVRSTSLFRVSKTPRLVLRHVTRRPFFSSLFGSKSVDLNTRPTVVVVGSGYAGGNIAQRLDKKVNVVLVERKNHYFHNIGALRPVTDPSTLYKALVPYDRLLTNGAFIQAQVSNITDKQVELVGVDKPLKFDFAVIATGSSYAFPMKSQLTKASDVPAIFDECAAQVQQADNIVIVGAGPVGLELLGEIGHKYPNKKITVIQGGDKILVGDLRDELRQRVLKIIKDDFKNCKVVTGERVNISNEMRNELTEAAKNNKAYLSGKRTIETESGRKFEADLTFFATGTRLNTETYKNFFEKAVNPASGRLQCKPTMQVQGYDNVFAIGDVADMGPQMAAVSGDFGHAPIVENNVVAMCDGKPQNMKPFSIPAGMMFLPLGPEKGATQLPILGGKVVGATLTSKIKGADLFYSRAWKQMGYQQALEKITTSTGKDINAQLGDADIARLAKGVRMDESLFRKLVNGDAANPN